MRIEILGLAGLLATGALALIGTPAAALPTSCYETSPELYSCKGFVGTCYYSWTDDDPDGNSFDSGAHIYKVICLM